jgi:hypothetical protein
LDGCSCEKTTPYLINITRMSKKLPLFGKLKVTTALPSDQSQFQADWICGEEIVRLGILL